MRGSSLDIFRDFQKEARNLGVPLERAQITQFQMYLDALREWNKVVRLVSRDDTESILWQHFVDSLSPYPFLENTQNLLDIGSGAGFPGVPLKIALPSLQLHLVESQRRKVHFLKYLIRHLNLNGAIVHHYRIGQEGPLDSFQTIIARAVATPRVWLSWAVDLLEEGGQIILMLGPSADMKRLGDLFDTLGLRPYRTMNLELPVVKHRRRIVAVRRTGCFT